MMRIAIGHIWISMSVAEAHLQNPFCLILPQSEGSAKCQTPFLVLSLMTIGSSISPQGAHVLLQHIYKEHPPLKGMLDSSKLGGDDIKATVKLAILHYHPDKQVSDDMQVCIVHVRIGHLYGNCFRVCLSLLLWPLHNWHQTGLVTAVVIFSYTKFATQFTAVTDLTVSNQLQTAFTPGV